MTDHIEPSAESRAAGQAAAEMFSAFVRAGFTEDQAIKLVAQYMAAIGGEQ